MNFKYFLVSIFIFGITGANAQSIGDYQSGYQAKENEIFFSNTNGDVKIEFCTPAIFRVRYSWDRSFEKNEPYMVSNYNWDKVNYQTAENDKAFEFSTALIDIKVHKFPFKIEVFEKSGKLINADFSGAERNQESKIVTKKMLADEHFFGFGERMDFMDRRGKKLKLDVGRGKGLPHLTGAYDVLQANYCPVTFFMSTRGYGIFLHNSFASHWDMGATDKEKYTFSAADGELDYYFMYGPDFTSLLDKYTAITGKSPLMPKFALGLHVGTYSGGTWSHEDMTSTQYVVNLARKMREQGIPADLIWLDSTWRLFGENGGKGATTFEWRETFKDPKAMFDSIYAMNYKMVGLHVRPRFDNANKLNLLDQAREKGFTYPENGKPGEFVNFFDQKAVDWWWENGVMRVASLGAKFLKTDEGSAFGALANESDKIGPTGKEAEKLHNIFPLAYAKAPYEAFQKYNGIRGLNQTREGYAGIQKYPFIFAGDWPSEWQYFAPVIKAGINIGLSGVSAWAHCMGGFEHPADPELYIRWVQFGMFSPVALVFGMDHPGYKEPWNYGADALRNFKKYDSLRYRMQPYLYSAMYQNYLTGLPMMRALVIDNQDDENTYEISDQYMLGDHLMVCPVTVKGALTRSVYLPKGTWFDYWTGKKYEGKNYIQAVSPLDTIPLFVKAGCIIAMQPEMKYTDEKPVDKITLDIFPIAGTGTKDFTLFEDDGTSLNYQSGRFAKTVITVSSNQAMGFNLLINKAVGDFKPAEKTWLAKIRWNNLQTPSSIKENNKVLKRVKNLTDLDQSAGWYFEEKEQVLWVQSSSNNNKSLQFQIQ